MIRSFIIIGLILTNFFQKSHGQNYVDLIKFTGQSTPSTAFKGSPENTRVTEFGVELMAPIKFGSKNIWLTNVAYEEISVRLWESQDYEELTSVTIRTGLVRNHSDKVTGTYLLVPRLSSASKSSLRERFQFGGLVLFKFVRSQQLNFKFGLFASSDFFSPFITPLIGYYLLSTDGKWEINALLPASFNLNRVLANSVDVGLNFNGQIKGFHLNRISSTGDPGYIVRSSNEACGYIKIKLAKNLFVQARVGYSIGRSYRVYDAKDKIDFAISFVKLNDHRNQLNTDFNNGMVGQVGIFYRLPTN